MHLMTFAEIAKPTAFERIVILIVQWVFYIGFFLALPRPPRAPPIGWSAISRRRR